MAARRTQTEARTAERAIFLADASRSGPYDLDTIEGRAETWAAFTRAMAEVGQYVPRRPPEHPEYRDLWDAARQARAAMCDHGLLPAHCAGLPDIHHRWNR